MNSTTIQPRPQVSGDSSGCAGVDGHHASPGVRGAKNLRARSNRQTTLAHVLKDTDTLNVMTYNVCTLMKDERLLELENALKVIKWDIIGLAEVRRLGEETVERDDSIFFHFGETQGLYGIGFLVAKKWKENIIEFIGYSERIAVLKFQLNVKNTLTIIQTYAPTSAHSDEAIEDFYDLLNKVCEENRGSWTIVLGDFNAKIGEKQANDNTDTIGNFGLGQRNDRGTRLIQFAFGQNMFISNSFFANKPQRRWTWVSPAGFKNEIDYILSSSKDIIKNVSVINRIKYSSDHRPLRTKLKFNFKILRSILFTRKVGRHSKHTLMNNQEQYTLELTNHFAALNMKDLDDPEEQYNNIVQAINICNKKITSGKKSKFSLSETTYKLIKLRQETVLKSEEHRKIDKKVKRSIRSDVRNHNTFQVRVALENNRSLRVAKQGISKGKTWINSLQDRNGKKHNSRVKIQNICTEFYKHLYSDPSKPNFSDTNTNYNCSDTIPFITGREVHDAIKSMHYEKSPGEDGVTTESLKVAARVLLPHITNLFNAILQTGKFPVKMCHSNIVLLFKKGDKSNINNYRPISLVSHIYKAFIKVILKRIEGTLDYQQPPEQAGFRPSYSTTDHLHTLNQTIERYTEYNKPLYLAFVDYTKAFDSIRHTSIFSALESQNIEKTYIDLLKIIYNISSANIKLNSSGIPFLIERGVKQGDPLSPKLFTSTLQEIFKKLDVSWCARGILVGDKRLTNLRFADDIVLFAQSAPELQILLQDLSTASQEVGLLMNQSKTQLMTNSTRRRVEVDGQQIHYVDEYIYLGQLASFENRQDKEVGRRVDNAWKSYWSMKALMKGDLPLSLKRKLVDMCILPVLTYGAQTWSLTESQKTKLGVCQRAMERSILGIKRTDQVRNTTLRSKTGIADVGRKAAKLKWEWAGHVTRMEQDRWAKEITGWIPVDGKRRRGRPRKRWRDDLDVFNSDWVELARDREGWKELGETFAQQWDSTG